MQKKTLDLIVETKKHYIICFKKNVGKFYDKIKSNTEKSEYLKSKTDKIEMNRGRMEYRQLSVNEASPEIKSDYPHCKSVICIKRARLIKGKESEETHYFLSDLELSAIEFFECTRGHWSIENRLHWVKDVIMKEDEANLINKPTACTLSILRSFVITLANIFTGSVTKFQRQYAHNIDVAYIL
jgi:predicted transposase YbfD/YdcC